MPLIQINIVEGRPPEKKERLIREVSDLVANVRGTSRKCPGHDTGNVS